MSAKYPSAIPTEEISLIISMLTGQVPRDRNKILQAGWCVQGYLMGLVFPVSDTEGVVFKMACGKDVPMLDDYQGLMALKAMSGSQELDEMSAQGFLGDLIGGRITDELAKLILPLITRWLSKWLTEGGLEDLIQRIIDLIGGGSE